MSATVAEANSPQSWEDRRFQEQMPEASPTYFHRMAVLLTMCNWALGQQRNVPAAILDLAAGTGGVGVYARQSAARGAFPSAHYHATEQSLPIVRHIKERLPGSSVAVWSYRGATGGPSLQDALREADDSFQTEYPVVLLSHLLEHVEDYYGLLDQAWGFVRPGGFLVVAVPRQEEHRTHYTRWDWERLLSVLKQYGGEGVPIATWQYGSYADLYAAVGKEPRAEDAPAVAAARGNGTAGVVAHSDPRLQRTQPLGLESARPIAPAAQKDDAA